jgi:nicotinate-nucleotide adenylyltransferase
MGRMITGKRIGYFGGTFDPPHLGHLVLTSEAYHQLKLDRLDWILTPDPPHKTDRIISPVEIRLEMLQLIIDKRQQFSINPIDINRDPPHYAADTVELIKNENPLDELVYVIGEDSLQDLPGWYAPDRFISAIDTLVIAPRPGISTDLMEMERAIPGLAGKTLFLHNVMFEIASSVIRDRVNKSEPFEHFLPDEISDYLKNRKLYK